ncbi:hypothetical protein CPJCM30710_31320 [Clostridium polyendosporum]|uniref:FHA domain-containing protein n=1 Tax=Clostridium polyendosporum TaxID=69208 RepID=A0A919VI74_9CLOT|nr:FHA domain-containing protein [Clostridium polyendosporum]GIM30466.1 hypothetical protein CPJCM30710_31320 [Clostridium polyendosporum]
MKDLIDFILSDKVYIIMAVAILFSIVLGIILITKLVKEINVLGETYKRQIKVNRHKENLESVSNQNDCVNRNNSKDNFKTESIVNNNPDLNIDVDEIPILKPEVKAEIISSIESNNEVQETQIFNVQITRAILQETKALKESKSLATLVCHEGEQIKEYYIGKNTTNIGRDSEVCDIVILNDEHIGRKHALIYFKNNHFYLVDLNSKNGTYVNSDRIEGERQIHDGDIIKLATTELKFKIY